MNYSIAVDSGGTFADCIVVDAQGRVTAAKAPSTPDDYSRGVLDSVARAAEQLYLSVEQLLAETTLFAHGTTVATNALLTRSGSKTGLITTKGHEDALIIGRTVQKVAGLSESEITYLVHLDKADPLVPRPLIKGVTERVDYKGAVIVPLNEKEVQRAAQALVAAGCEAIAVSLLWSFLHPAHEKRIRELILALYPDILVSLSHELAPVIKEYERTATTAINAYLGQVTGKYLESLVARLKAQGFQHEPVIMQSSGGVVPVAQAQARAVSLLSSGPAGGVMGAVALGQALGHRDLITTDVGGTSFDVGLVVDGEPQFSLSPVFAKYHTVLPSIDIPSIGAGGGSIAWIEPGTRLLKVGPRSAGAVPGPVSYDAGGTEPTVTDANVVLNRLNPDFFLGGAKRLNADKARAAIEEKIARPLGVSVEEAALGMVDILDAKMADLVRKVSIGRGYDPRDFALLAFGGAGPLHVGAYARDVGVREIIIPAHSSEFSAWGIVGSDLVNLRQVSEPMLAPFDPARLNAIYHTLEEQARETLAREGIVDGNVSFARYIDMRYRGQIHEVRVPVTTGELGQAELAALHQTFEDIYNRKYGQGAAYRKAGIEARTYQVRGIGRIPKPAWVSQARAEPDASAAQKETRQVYFRGGWRPTPVYAREQMRAGNCIQGPALVEAVDTTVLVPPGMSLTIDEYANMVMTNDDGRRGTGDGGRGTREEMIVTGDGGRVTREEIIVTGGEGRVTRGEPWVMGDEMIVTGDEAWVMGDEMIVTGGEGRVTSGEPWVMGDEMIVTGDEIVTTHDGMTLTNEEVGMMDDERRMTDDAVGMTDDERRMTNDERRMTDDERRMTNDERRMTDDERRMTDDAVGMMDDERRMTNDERRMTDDERRMTNEEVGMTDDERRMTNDERRMTDDEGRMAIDGMTLSDDEGRMANDELARSAEQRRMTSDEVVGADREFRTAYEKVAPGDDEHRMANDEVVRSADESQMASYEVARSDDSGRMTDSRVESTDDERRMANDEMGLKDDERRMGNGEVL